MFATRASRRRGIAYALLLAASLLLLALSGAGALTPLRAGVSFALAPIQDALSGLTRGATSLVGTIGEEVFTAGIELGGGIRSPYPKGLLIGRVVDVKRDPNDVVQTVYLEPAADLDHLEFVLIITDYQGGITGPIGSIGPCLPTASGALPDSDQPCGVGGQATPKP